MTEYEDVERTYTVKQNIVPADKNLKAGSEVSSISYACTSLPHTSVPSNATEVCVIKPPGLSKRVDLEDHAERTVFTTENSKRVGILKDAVGEHLIAEEHIQRQINNHFTIAPSSYPPKLALKFKLPPYVSESKNCSPGRLAPGTGVFYNSRRSITSKGYGKVCIVEALSLLADVSCSLKYTHVRSTVSTSKRSKSDAYKGCFNWGKSSASTKKTGNDLHCKESYTEKRSKNLSLRTGLAPNENMYKVVRKLRTPRKSSPASILGAAEIQKNISLSTCDEYTSCTIPDCNLTNTNQSSGRMATSGTTTVSSAENFLHEGKNPDQKSTTKLIQVRSVKKPTTLERVSKALHHLCNTKKRLYKGLRRTERFTHQILRFIGDLTVPEKLIRQALGNNPDTSKALRLLLTEKKLTRLGNGGRGRAYEYVATEKGLHQLRELEQATSTVELSPESANDSARESLAGATITSDASKSNSPTEGTKDPNAVVADPSRPNSVTPPATPTVTPHRPCKWPVQTVICTTSSQSFDLQLLGTTECKILERRNHDSFRLVHMEAISEHW